MNDRRDDDLRDDLRATEREIRAWATRPPSRSPGAARTRVLARLAERRAGRGWRLAAATFAVLALFSGYFLQRSPAPSGVGLEAPPAVAQAGPVAAGLLIYELSSGTQLYFDLASSRPAARPPENAFQR